MQSKRYFLPTFLICFGIIVVIFLLGRLGWLGFLTDGIQSVVSPLYTFSSHPKEDSKLQKENLSLTMKLAKMQQIEADNQALRDQFQTTSPVSQNLLPVQVVGMDNIPHVSFPQTLVINAGKSDGLHQGTVVVLHNELIGSVVDASNHFAKVQLITNPSTSFSIKDQKSNAIGVAKGLGNGEIELDNILLSDTVTVGDIVVTLGSQDVSGKGLPPDLVVGKISSVTKNPSNLFQQAKVVPLVSFDSLFLVFVLR